MFQPRKTEEDAEDDEDEEVLLRIPGSFNFEDHGGGAERGAGAGIVNQFDAVGILWEFVAADAADMIVWTKEPY